MGEKIRWRWFFYVLLGIGVLLARPAGVRADSTADAKALDALTEKAEDGDAAALYELGMDYQRGHLVEMNLPQALDTLQRAANAGSVRAMDRLGDMYHDGDCGMARDQAAMVKWYQREADAGGASGMVSLGLCYDRGTGVDKNPATAKSFYKQAWSAAHKDVSNTSNMDALGGVYMEGLGIDKDDSMAMTWFRKAADAGNAVAMDSVGSLYENGIGADKDLSQAAIWYHKAADAGNEHAKKWLAAHPGN